MSVRARLGLLGLLWLSCMFLPEFSRLFAAEPAANLAANPIATPTPTPSPTSSRAEYIPGEGFDVTKGRYGSLNIGAYVLLRYLNQLPATQSFVDHLGRTRQIDTRNDIQLHRILIHFRGFLFTEKLTQQTSAWAVNSTNSSTLISSLNYEFSKKFILGGGIGALPGTRSLNYEHPYFLGTDRQMGDEFFRPSFTSGIWISGEAFPKLQYRAMVGNSINMVDISAAQFTRDKAYAGTLAWFPTTGEFGPRGGYGDFEMHDRLATRFGVSGVHSREDRFNDLNYTKFPDNTTIRVSDSLNLFEEGALAPGVIIQKSDYNVISVDAGMKHRGFFLFGEYYFRKLGKFDANGPLPINSMFDHGYMLQASYMLKPQKIEIYGANSLIFGEFNRPFALTLGMNIFPWKSRSFRLNGSVTYVDRSPVSSLFGYFVGGQKGPTISIGTDFIL